MATADWPNWESDVLSAGHWPQTQENRDFLEQWAKNETGSYPGESQAQGIAGYPAGMHFSDGYNPLNMDYGPPGGQRAIGWWQSQGAGSTEVAIFPNAGQGALGTAERIGGGRYDPIAQGLASGKPFEQPGITGSLSSWGTTPWFGGSNPSPGSGGQESPLLKCIDKHGGENSISKTDCLSCGGQWTAATCKGPQGETLYYCGGAGVGDPCGGSSSGGSGSSAGFGGGLAGGLLAGGLLAGLASGDISGIIGEVIHRVFLFAVGCALVYMGGRALPSSITALGAF